MIACRITAAVVQVALTSVICAAEPTVSVERNDAATATEEYKFSTIPPPSKTDAACVGRIGILAGQVDANSGRWRRLIDGAGARSKDDPENNFFFRVANPSSPGRLLLTLGEPTDIQAIHTYSWHPDVRGPQIYTVFGDAADEGLPNPEGNERDPSALGWSKIAVVATRRVVKEVGGQYAVRIAVPDGSLGRHKRLIFDIWTTDERSPFANTFFSEIDILDGKEYPAPPVTEIDWLDVGDRYRIGFDTSETPDLKTWVDEKLKPVCATWYPKIVELLPSDQYAPPEKFTITFREDMAPDSVAYCSRTLINCNARWYRTQLKKEALGSIVHEMVHVVQQYPRARVAADRPGWLVEGLADYIRWHLYEPASARRTLNPRTVKYTDSYHVTGAFLAYLVDQKGPDVITKLNAALRQGTYTADTWTAVAGGTVDDLWVEFVKTLKPK